MPTIDNINSLADRLVRLLRSVPRKNTLCFRYNELCLLDTIQVDVVPEKKGEQKRFSPRKTNVFNLKFDFLRCYHTTC